MHSAIYRGKIRHRRFAPVEHDFAYSLFMMYLDLDELDTVFAGSRLFSASRRAPARFCREDHLGEVHVPLGQAVRDLVERETGRRPDGPVRLLTHLRFFGYVFNPVSFYYCFNKDDTHLDTIVAEVNNTPWGERHCYVLRDEKNSGNGLKRYRPVKSMHVSPFMPMDIDYDWRFRKPDEVLAVHMENFHSGRKLFDATLQLSREAITPASLLLVLARFPLMTLNVIVGIHWQALKLWLKGCPVYDHPGKQAAVAPRVKNAAQDGDGGVLMGRTK